jgi:hypothetical protein
MSILPHDPRARHAEDVLPLLREAFSQRPAWREFSPHQLSVLLFFWGYTTVMVDEHDVAAALPLALGDLEPDRGAA